MIITSYNFEMSNSVKIGVIGKGFVGSAVTFGFSPGTGADYEIKVFDKDLAKATHSLTETINDSDFVFISVPTPSDKDGLINLQILDNCLSDINNEYKDGSNTIFLLRSTIVPGSSRKFQDKYPRLKLVFNPEFLTERSASFDFISQTRYVLGGDKENTSLVADLYKQRFGKTISVVETDFESAELIKYMCNTYFALKVSFLNEMRLLSVKSNADWEDCIEGFVRDGRIGHSHMQVPGPDGKPGFGGSCFPKDIQAIIKHAESLGIELNTLEGAWKTNLQVRPERDWEKLKGRAISDES